MADVRVTCIVKPHPQSSHEHITHIGNITNDPANRWRLAREEAIRRIEAKEEAFYTVDRATGNKMYIDVVRETGRNPFLRTHADGKWNDNLLAQTECDGTCKLL